MTRRFLVDPVVWESLFGNFPWRWLAESLAIAAALAVATGVVMMAALL